MRHNIIILTLLAVAMLLPTSSHATKRLGADAVIGQTQDFTIYTFKNPKEQMRLDRIRDRMGNSKQARADKLRYGDRILNEENYEYVYFRVVFTDYQEGDKILIPKGKGNFVLTVRTDQGVVEIPDQGAFIWRERKLTPEEINSLGEGSDQDDNKLITAHCSLDDALFINPTFTYNNNDGEPRLLIRFPQVFWLEQMLKIDISPAVKYERKTQMAQAKP